MSAENKTHEQIVAEVRFHAQQNIDAEKDKPEFGILTAEGRIAPNYADELEAAHKREIEELKPKPDPDWNEICAKCNEGIEPSYCEYFGDPCGCNSPIYQHHPQTQRNNAAKLREAVVNISRYADCAAMRPNDAHTQEYIEQIRKWANAALKAPARNCDRFTNLHDAWLAWQAYCAEHMEDPTMKKFQVWLYDTAKEAV